VLFQITAPPPPLLYIFFKAPYDPKLVPIDTRAPFLSLGLTIHLFGSSPVCNILPFCFFSSHSSTDGFVAPLIFPNSIAFFFPRLYHRMPADASNSCGRSLFFEESSTRPHFFCRLVNLSFSSPWRLDTPPSSFSRSQCHIESFRLSRHSFEDADRILFSSYRRGSPVSVPLIEGFFSFPFPLSCATALSP